MKMIAGMQVPIMTRTVYHSAKAEAKWAPLIQEINRAWPDIEREAVAQGIRSCALQPLSRLDYLRLLPWAQERGLYVRIHRTVAKWQGFAHHYVAADDDNGYLVTAVGSTVEAAESPEAHLGYPECCQKAFAGYFPAIVDPIHLWAGGKEVTAHPYTNPLLRYINVRFAPHIPCSASCEATMAFGAKMATVMPPSIKDAIWGLLEAPISWDCYRGVAIVTHPDFRLVVGSNASAERWVVNVRSV